MSSLVSIFLNILFFTSSYSQNIKYLNGLSENDSCEYNNNEIGICKKISDCQNEFENFKHKKSDLKVCNYHRISSNTAICCPNKSLKLDQLKTRYTLDFETCLNQNLANRRSRKDATDLINAINFENRTISDEDCKNIALYGLQFTCENKIISSLTFIVFGNLVKEGDYANMAAIGWTQSNNEIKYNCGGTIVNERFIITAAHCNYYRGKSPDVVRVGDRFLATTEDDEYAQQLAIEKFITHPSYKPSENYHDIAIIKTQEQIKFSMFVAPACILRDLNSKWFLNIAGYGQTDFAENASNTLQEIVVKQVENSECNMTFTDQPKVPKGIIDSQLCVQGIVNSNGDTPDSCLGDSGGPVQYQSFKHAINDDDYERTKLKTVYDIPVVAAIVSFGVGCALEIPSVNTRISFYINWLESAMNEN
ncbi:hypothetical protein PVAND_005297 [Polypedilum vanderplanki]|uniref:Peptidase S1 domain-containing protein n=1 Tax=Polypedilum vanderplanki TaxID=319348 RepID=A0A9J6C0L3_POLVA|nr:hypothetical protein PVAND_005297 [Polypedilum vanderplanki]